MCKTEFSEGGELRYKIHAYLGESHAYLVNELNLTENAEEKSAEFVNRVCQVTLETFLHLESEGGRRL